MYGTASPLLLVGALVGWAEGRMEGRDTGCRDGWPVGMSEEAYE